jgi:histidine triad (HIT) family protein
MESHFTPYISGEKREWIIAENENFLAIIEEYPLVLGHCVVLPKVISDSWNDLSDQSLRELMIFAKKISHAIKEAILCKKVGLAAIGLQVRHAHLHLVPISSADDLNFTRTKLQPTREELLNTVGQIKAHITD